MCIRDSGYAGHIQLGESGELMAILAHMDVVPAAGQWTFDPYSAVVSDGKLYGLSLIHIRILKHLDKLYILLLYPQNCHSQR